MILHPLHRTRSPLRGQVMCLRSVTAGLRAKDIAALTWAMVTDTAGQVAETLHLEHRAGTGGIGGRTIPLPPDVPASLVALQTWRGAEVLPERPVLHSARGRGVSADAVPRWFHQLSTSLGLTGRSSHGAGAPASPASSATSRKPTAAGATCSNVPAPPACA